MKTDTEPPPLRRVMKRALWWVFLVVSLYTLKGFFGVAHYHGETVEPTPVIVQTSDPNDDKSVQRLRTFFERRNPNMVQYALDFVINADHFNIDPYLVASIGCLESGYYTKCSSVGNCYGIKSGNGYAVYQSIREGVAKASQFLTRDRYIRFSQSEPADIQGIHRAGYAEDPRWAGKVMSIYNDINK